MDEVDDCRECEHWKPGPLRRVRADEILNDWREEATIGEGIITGGLCLNDAGAPPGLDNIWLNHGPCSGFSPASAHEKAERLRAVMDADAAR